MYMTVYLNAVLCLILKLFEVTVLGKRFVSSTGSFTESISLIFRIREMVLFSIYSYDMFYANYTHNLLRLLV